jgi:Cof subfamily protein (haloacid dehalogenase superfamily)
MKYKLIAVDMDGTLLNDDSEVTERSKAAILQAVEAGALFVAATGRPMIGVENINALFDKDMPFITFNGGTVVMGKSKRVLLNRSLSAHHTKQIYEEGIRRGIPVVLWVGGILWVSQDCEAIKDYKSIGIESNIVTDINKLAEEGTSKLIWIDSPENVKRLQDEMNEVYYGRVNCHASRPQYLEFVDFSVSKGAALEVIGGIYGINRSEMIAVGDGYNDISMLKYAGLGVAMANAPEDIKAVCRHVTLSNNEDGVAEVIYRYITGNAQ